jgi:hypothetical protein
MRFLVIPTVRRSLWNLVLSSTVSSTVNFCKYLENNLAMYIKNSKNFICFDTVIWLLETWYKKSPNKKEAVGFMTGRKKAGLEVKFW